MSNAKDVSRHDGYSCEDIEARLEEVQHCCDKAVVNRAKLDRLDAELLRMESWLSARTDEIETGNRWPSVELTLLAWSQFALALRTAMEWKPSQSGEQIAPDTAEPGGGVTPKERYAQLDRRCSRLVLVMLALAILNSSWGFVPVEWGRQWFQLATVATMLGLFWYLTRQVKARTAASEEIGASLR